MDGLHQGHVNIVPAALAHLCLHAEDGEDSQGALNWPLASANSHIRLQDAYVHSAASAICTSAAEWWLNLQAYI